ncbi:MAG TPA: BON domain-containing protein [Polyangiaceae bacterium]|jgi:hypothetical protein
MFYTYGGWWFAWFIPIMLLVWAMFGWSMRRPRLFGMRDRYSGWDDPWAPDYRITARRYRNRGPLNYRRSDSRIAEDVNDLLMLNDELDPSAMEVRVENGEVFLTGLVQTRYEKRLAEHLADSVAGVKDVENRLAIGKLQPPTQARPAEPVVHARNA